VKVPDTLPLTPSAWRDPADVFLTLARQHGDVFWLDAGPGAARGWSWIGWGNADDPALVHAAGCVGGVPAGAPAPFAGGWVGWIGYEPGAAAAGAPVHAADPGIPQQLWLAVQGLVAFDHAAGRMWSGGAVDPAAPAPAPPRSDLRTRTARGRNTPDEYAGLIEDCRAAIRAGDAYQLCLTTRFTVDGDVDPVAAYLALRSASAAHHGGIIRSGSVALLSSSPERFLEVHGTTVQTHPIKGTRRRGADAASDAALAAELAADPKERAENVMIVDLMRNDLSRVCVPATVRVDRLLEVESYPSVHQLVSAVAGTLPARTTVGELLTGAFPAGSMTGAPKLSAMTILHRLEAAPRGVYAGCFGWIGATGGLDLAMVIRSIVTHPGGAYVGAGGGITWRSVAAAEVAEVGLKARAPLAALGAEVPAGW
jgi:anthranilate synthase component 1